MKNFSLRPQEFSIQTLELLEQGFYIFETMLAQKGEVPLAHYHHQRIQNSLSGLSWPKKIDDTDFSQWWKGFLGDIKVLGVNEQRIKLSLIPDQRRNTLHFKIAIAPYSRPEKIFKLSFHSEAKRHSEDSLWKYKMGQRASMQYFLQNLPEGFDDVVFVNEKNEICETTRHNIYIKKEGQLITPPLSSGLLPGVFRSKLLEEKKVLEQVITKEDLCKSSEIFLSNALTGLISASL